MALRRKEFRFDSTTSRIARAGFSTGPSSPSGLASVALWLEAGSGTLSENPHNVVQSVPTNGHQVQLVLQPGDSFSGTPAHAYAEQTSAPSDPTIAISSGRYWMGGGASIVMSLSSAVSLTGDFVAWFVITRTASTALVLLGSDVSTAGIVLDAAGTITFDNGSGSIANTLNPDGAALLRVRRVSNAVKAQCTGIAEINVGTLSGTLTAAQILGNTNSSAYSDATAKVGAFVISTDAGHAANPPAGIDGTGGYFDTSTANVGVAWGVHL